MAPRTVRHLAYRNKELKMSETTIKDACDALDDVIKYVRDDLEGTTTAAQEYACRRCPGYCCYRFKIPSARLDDDGRIVFPGVPVDIVRRSFGEHDPNDIFLVRKNIREIGSSMDDVPTLTCRHFDIERGFCGIHEDRPNTCRDFRCWSCRRGLTPDERKRDEDQSPFEFGPQRRMMDVLERRRIARRLDR